ncbi:MAG: aminoacyl--tRNA ligase-related protein [Candidatus Nanohaloarchaea archaeon]
MRRSELFVTSSKQSRADTSCRSEELALRAGLVRSYGSGTFGFSHLGHRVLENIESVVREELDGKAQEVRMNVLQSSDIWRKSGRWKNFEGDEFFHLENRDGKDFTIAATHEEAAVELARDYIRSYRDLDLAFYQIGRKFRDDRARKGLLRTKEFLMKDAYSFHSDRGSLEQKYDGFLESYRNIFDRLGLDYSVVAADNGSMGGSRSHEFLAESEVGSDRYLKCRECEYGTKELERSVCESCGSELEEVSGIEIGHMFELGTRYSDAMDLEFVTESGDSEQVLMASYGIGVTRLIAAIIEQNHDSRGIAWNREVSGFDASIIVARHEDRALRKAEQLYQKLSSEFDVLLYDRLSAGEQFAESDLIGVGKKIVIGNRYLETGKIELEDRSGETREVDEDQLMEQLR